MMMENLFESKTDEELRMYFEQFQEWEKTGVLPDNELGKMRDIYFERLGMSWQMTCMLHMLKTIAFRWAK